ncbi:MAG: DUF4918 family protein [Desulfovibrio sp.]|nr:DUF4918 family protein [Desulfovibrio sp.]
MKDDGAKIKEKPGTFGERMDRFNAGLQFTGKLPEGFGIMNPFRENECATAASREFYDKYYNDNRPRGIILGINPGRFGAGITGVPFTDPKRLAEFCDIRVPSCPDASEPSSRFVYKVIGEYGGAEKFYREWYINSVCPLGFIRTGEKTVNANYYDSPALMRVAEPFIIKTLKEQCALGVDRRVCVCMGIGKNAKFLEKINGKHKFFDEIIPIEHPRFIVQYRSAEIDAYAGKYVELLKKYAPDA